MEKENILKIEKEINKILFYLCFFITFITMIMALVEFFSRGEFPPPQINTFYIFVLLIYSLHKEAIRWIEEKGKEWQQRKGEFFVYLWILLTAILYLINFLTKNYFSFSPRGQRLSTLNDITFLTIEVGGVFLFTRLLKIATFYFFNKKEKKEECQSG
jgi:uncharacterized Tic20 family protein